MDPTTELILARLDRAIVECQEATKAAFALARAMTREADAKLSDDDDWTRMPKRGQRSAEGWSQTVLRDRMREGKVRKKSVAGYTYYSAADVRRIINA